MPSAISILKASPTEHIISPPYLFFNFYNLLIVFFILTHDKEHPYDICNFSNRKKLVKVPKCYYPNYFFIRKELFGTEFTVVASYNSGSFTKQNETYKKDKIIILEKLEKIKQSVERTGRGKKKDLKKALIEASKFIYEGYKKVFIIDINEKENIFSYKVDKDEEEKLFLTFGKNLIFTDMHDWPSEKIVKSYTPICFIAIARSSTFF